MTARSRGLVLCLLLIGLACAPAQAPAGTSAPAAPARAPAAAAPAGQPASAGAAQPAWQPEWDRVLAAARQEGSVVVDGPPGDAIRRNMLDGFQKAYPGITLEWMAGTSPEQAAKLEAERRAGVYGLDVMLGGTAVLITRVKNPGFLDPVKPALILPEVTDTANWLDGQMEFADYEGQHNLVFINMPSGLAAHNPNTVRTEDIDELYKLLDPRWRGQIVISDPMVGGQGQGAFLWLWGALGPERATEYIRALKAQAGAVDRDRRRMTEWVARGRYAILFNPDTSVYQQQLKNEGLPLAVLPGFKDHGTYVTASFGSLGLVNRAPHPNAAKVFINWLLGKEGQTIWSTTLGHTSRRVDVPRDHLPPEAIIHPGGKYWRAYHEGEVEPAPALVNLLTEVFGR